MTEFQKRIQEVAKRLTQHSLDCLFITPGADLRYFTGYNALPLERLTCLAIRNDGEAILFVPHLELPAAQVHEPERSGIQLHSWQETENPYERLHQLVGSATSVAVNDVMWTQKAFGIRDAFSTEVHLAGNLLSDLRSIKTPAEIEAIYAAGVAIDQVHNNMHQWIRVGRTEREVGRDIADAIISSGHATVDFVIVASGPNGASAHHEVSDRVIQQNEPIVVDIGGTMPSGYCSDSTRMYACGDVSTEFMSHYEILQNAQARAVADARIGMTGADVDAISRSILAEADLADYFVHRTGHGLGLETHEEPYIVATNHQPLVAGNVFSIEPGFYIPGQYGARIEDIVYLTESGAVSVNNSSHNLRVL